MVRLGPAFIVVKLSNEQQHAIHAWSEETSYLILLVDKTFVKRVAISGKRAGNQFASLRK